MATLVNGFPTKEFFVEMLTRDIDLTDAILDLLDNCLDGVLRKKGVSTNSSNPDIDYSGYSANITITNDSFSIQDNCGGISKYIAINSAFRMGREANSSQDNNLPTVGIYGIGMKRAIFKIGREAKIISKCNDEQFVVTIPDEWTKNDSWNLELQDISSVPDGIADGGVIVTVTQLNQSIAALWADDRRKNFINNLINAVQKSYSLIIEKGFSITINDIEVKSWPVKFMISAPEKGKGAIGPYIYKDTIDGVNVDLIIGFYRPVVSADEIDEINATHRSSSDAGWTVVCNDRVVLYNDKTHLTGWGEGGTPKYHTQFIGIRGMVFFRSNNPKLLPTTTTKRGIDLSSAVYSQVKERMREGLNLFISYTNQWKGRLDEEKKHSKATDNVSMHTLLSDQTIQDKYNLSSTIRSKRGSTGTTFVPTLPKPETTSNTQVIRYFKPVDQIEFLAECLFDQTLDDIKASVIGEKCFDLIYKRFKGEK